MPVLSTLINLAYESELLISLSHTQGGKHCPLLTSKLVRRKGGAIWKYPDSFFASSTQSSRHGTGADGLKSNARGRSVGSLCNDFSLQIPPLQYKIILLERRRGSYGAANIYNPVGQPTPWNQVPNDIRSSGNATLFVKER
jgi:hypothetical protein